MRYLFILLSAILPAITHAQESSWHVGFKSGFVVNKVSFKNREVADKHDRAELWGGLKGWWECGRIQLGLTVEGGAISERIDYNWYWYENHQRVREVNVVSEKLDFFSPAVSPMLFVNYRFNLWGNIRLYAGPMIGVITGTNRIEGRNMTVVAGGTNVALSFKIYKWLRGELSSAWRIANIDMNNQPVYITGIDPLGNYAMYSLPDCIVESVANCFGVTVDL